MRILVFCAVLALGCRDKPPAALRAIYKFLPASPDLAIRVDLERLRGWPMYAKVAPRALKNVQTMLDAAKTACNTDVIAEAKTIVIAKRGSLVDGDLTLMITGLARSKVTSCLATLKQADAAQQLTVDGDVFHINRAGKPVGSGALLPSGELVFVLRGGEGIEPAAWRTELAAPAASPPGWWSELNATDPIAVRVTGPDKRGMFSVDLGEPLKVTGSAISVSAEAAKTELKMYQAVVEYLKEADAGTARLELSGEKIYGDLTATSAQVERLITMALPALFGTDDQVDPSATPVTSSSSNGPVECTSLAPAVETYLKTGLGLASATQKAEMERLIPTLVPRLQRAFVDSCNGERWSEASIRCHVDSAADLPRFEKCRNALSTEQRDKLDVQISAAMSPGAP